VIPASFELAECFQHDIHDLALLSG
jgi:hypothetical protein